MGNPKEWACNTLHWDNKKTPCALCGRRWREGCNIGSLRGEEIRKGDGALLDRLRSWSWDYHAELTRLLTERESVK